MLDRAGDAVEPGDQDDGQPPAVCVAQQGVQPRPPRLGAGDPDIRVFMDNFIPPVCSQLAKLVKLSLDVLVRGADPRIDCGFLHSGGSFVPKIGIRVHRARPCGFRRARQPEGGMEGDSVLPPIYYLAESGNLRLFEFSAKNIQPKATEVPAAGGGCRIWIARFTLKGSTGRRGWLATYAAGLPQPASPRSLAVSG